MTETEFDTEKKNILLVKNRSTSKLNNRKTEK